jgi:hypothetical protein
MVWTATHLRAIQMARVEESMATPGQLVTIMANALGMPAATVGQYDRVLAENGLRSKSGRGPSAARVTAGDMANLLLAIMASPISGAAIKDAARTCHAYGALPNIERAALRPNLRLAGLKRLADLPAKHSLHDALVALIEGPTTKNFRIEDPENPIRSAYSGGDHLLMVRVDSPYQWAEIFVDSGPGGNPAKWGRLVYTGFFQKHPGTAKPLLNDLHQSRRITFRTIRRLAEILRKAG